MLGADTGVVESGGDRVGLGGLPLVVLQDVAAAPCRTPTSPRQVSRRAGRCRPVAAGLDADRRPPRRRGTGEHADRVGAAADAGDDGVGQAPVCSRHWRGPRGRCTAGSRGRSSGTGAARRAADACSGCADVGHPVAHRLVDRVLEGARAGRHRHHLGAERPHPKTLSFCRRCPPRPCRRCTPGRVARAVAVATPCWPAPVSAMTRVLPIRRASRTWPSALLILWAPVWFRSSRLR